MQLRLVLIMGSYFPVSDSGLIVDEGIEVRSWGQG